jgi:hypothetical protein
MLSKCANPQCHAPFHYLRDGRLFQIEIGGGPRLVTDKKPQFRVEYFWLCSGCAASMTLAYQPGKGVSAVPLHAARRAAAS